MFHKDENTNAQAVLAIKSIPNLSSKILQQNKPSKRSWRKRVLSTSLVLVSSALIMSCSLCPYLPRKGAYLTDSGERTVLAIEPGSNVYAGVRGML